MAYAHARGVVHRDLKPANVMIGAFGEVKIVDWGMGKVLQQGGVADEKKKKKKKPQHTPTSIISTVRSKDGSSHSIAGSMMGTLAYMPPEQALGDIDRMDERSDVFSLGGILCEILTGEPPYQGDDMTELVEKARHCSLEDAKGRLDKCGRDDPMVKLALECLTPASLARPRNAGELADRVGSFLAQAEQRVQEAQIRARAAKRTQKLVLLVGVVIAAGLITTLMFWRRAQTALDQYHLMANVVKLRGARAAEAELYPAWPENAKAMQSWLEDRARPLRASLPELEAALEAVRATAQSTDDDALVFDEESTEFKHEVLARLVDDLRDFTEPTAGMLAAVEHRLDWAIKVERLTIAQVESKWQEARAALRAADGVLASERYREVPIDLEPQMGLVPIGMNPVTKLWEFYHVASAQDTEGPLPSHRSNGAIQIHNGLGIVFVLIPGGAFVMGAQNANEDEANYDPQVDRKETPSHVVELAPYFLAKYEMTQAQWQRLSRGGEPSNYRAGQFPGNVPITGSNPVEG